MNWNEHSRFKNTHAFLSPSRYHWVNYDEDKLISVYTNYQAKLRGTELHAFAAEAIRLGIKLPRNSKTLNMYVNDAIGFRMSPEVCLFYSSNAFGTADTISFKKKRLRIHDLKTGITPTSFKQLEIYASLFCLEYDFHPNDIFFELRIYQQNEVKIYEPDRGDLLFIMEKIRVFDKVITEYTLKR